MPRTDSWFPVVLLLLLAAVSVWLSQAIKVKPPVPPTLIKHEADAVVEKFTATQYAENGAVRYVLKAEKMLHYPDDGSSTLEKVFFQGFEPDRAPFSVRAKEGQVTKDQQDVYFWGDVRAVQDSATGQSPLILTTEKLHVRPDEGVAKTDQPVVIEQGSGRATGHGLVIDNKTRTAILTHVRATYNQTAKQ